MPKALGSVPRTILIMRRKKNTRILKMLIFEMPLGRPGGKTRRQLKSPNVLGRSKRWARRRVYHQPTDGACSQLAAEVTQVCSYRREAQRAPGRRRRAVMKTGPPCVPPDEEISISLAVCSHFFIFFPGHNLL